jgi:hypothetical protein
LWWDCAGVTFKHHHKVIDHLNGLDNHFPVISLALLHQCRAVTDQLEDMDVHASST